jgi:hypothetical protein
MPFSCRTSPERKGKSQLEDSDDKPTLRR